MHRIHFTRALIVLTLIGTLAALPATAQAATRVDDGAGDGDGFSLVRVVVDWVSERVRSIWGAGGPAVEPTGNRPPPGLTAEEGVPDRSIAADEGPAALGG
jgi:hypothetical protein